MKILFVNNFFSEYGGAEKILLNQASLLQKNNIEVFFFASSKPPLFIEDYEYKKYFPEHTEIRKADKLSILKNFFNIFYNPSAKANLKAYIKEIKPDIVHIHNINYILTSSVLDACKELRIPTIMSVHDPRMICPGGALRFENKTYCKDEKCLNSHPFHCIFNKCKDGSFKSSTIATAENLFVRQSRKLDYVSCFITPSMTLYNLLIRAGFEKTKLKFIPHFLDDRFFENQPNYTNQGYFLYIGRLAKEKGLDYLLKAASTLPEEIKIHIVGDGPQRAELEITAKILNLKNVIFKGFMEGLELEEEYKNCIATILPCNWFEVFGLTIIESFAYGKPVIASKIGAIPELVIDFENGFTFKPENTIELADAIHKMHYDKELVQKMSIKSRKKAEELFNSGRHYEQLIKVYESVL